MKKKFLELNTDLMMYVLIDMARTYSEKLANIRSSFFQHPEDFNIVFDKVLEENKILIWDQDDFRNRAEFKFETMQEEFTFIKAYEKYYDKRWDEKPYVEMALCDYEVLKQKWEKIKKEQPKYVIFILDDSGPLDKVDVIGKNELMAQDIQDMQCEQAQYLRWQKAEQLYSYDHEIIDDMWRSPVDSVYDADIAKYVDRTEGFVQHKIYTKADVIAELQERLKQKESVYLIVHWLHIRQVYGIQNSDQAFDDLLIEFAKMDYVIAHMISADKLQEIADRLSLGQDVIFDVYA